MEDFGAYEEYATRYDVVFILLLLHRVSPSLTSLRSFLFAFVKVVNSLGKRTHIISHRGRASVLTVIVKLYSSTILLLSIWV